MNTYTCIDFKEMARLLKLDSLYCTGQLENVENIFFCKNLSKIILSIGYDYSFKMDNKNYKINLSGAEELEELSYFGILPTEILKINYSDVGNIKGLKAMVKNDVVVDVLIDKYSSDSERKQCYENYYEPYLK